jgi:lysine 2,3-aminomutase
VTQVIKTVRSVAELRHAGLATAGDAAALEAVAARYAVAITADMVRLIDPSDPGDPIARQFVPDARELQRRPEERADPLGEARLSPVPGLVHRYPDRVLLKLTHVCPVYCRFCFRREVVGPGGPQALSGEPLDAALGYIAGVPGIWEVILTGGDPFMLSPRRIAEVTGRLGAIAHVKVLRWHTRVPAVQPGRVTADLVSALKSAGQTVYVAVHANHARELTPAARAACARIVDAGIPMLSQTVLLEGVNNDA